MCWESLTFCMLLLIASSLALQPSSTNDDNKDNNLTVREFGEDIKRNYDKKAELRKNYTNDNKDKCMMIIKIRKSQSLNHIVSHEMCDNITYIRILCCPLNNCSIHKNCIAEENEYVFSNVYNYSNDSMQNENKKVNKFCPLIVQNPRQVSRIKHFSHSYFEFVEITTYHLTNVHDDQFNAWNCLKAADEIYYKEMNKIVRDLYNKILSIELTILFYNSIVSMLCLLLIFLVYSILPELRNIHSFMLRRSISLAIIGYTIVCIDYLFNTKDLEYSICVISALVKYFCILTSNFWLSVMSFDMWWTFRNLWLQGNVSSRRQKRKQQERKKFIYSTIAWGGPLILIIICIIMEFVSGVPKIFRPGFCGEYCWFYGDEAYWLYSFGPESISVIISTCLSIYTALKIMRYEKDTTRHLSHLERQSFNDKKQRFNLYLKLFIVLFIMTAIQWIITIIWEFWLINDITKQYIILFHIIILMDTMQNIGTFVIFVCKKKIMQLLLKHFCQNHGSISNSSRQNRCYELQQLRHH